jgi:hypothetical protein
MEIKVSNLIYGDREKDLQKRECLDRGQFRKEKGILSKQTEDLIAGNYSDLCQNIQQCYIEAENSFSLSHLSDVDLKYIVGRLSAFREIVKFINEQM